MRRMPEEEFQAGLAALRVDWGGLRIRTDRPGICEAVNDSSTGILVGLRARIVAEIINRALAG